jgi:hypothetical protein
MTIIIDDAGIGDLLFGVVIGAFRDQTHEFTYGVVDVKYFKSGRFRRKEYLKQSSTIISRLLEKLKVKHREQIHVCQSYIFDQAVKDLERKYGETRIRRVKVVGEPQCLTEVAYLDEIRNLGYEPISERESHRGKSFFHMMRWLSKDPDRLRYAKTGWPRLARYGLFRKYFRN